MLEGKNQIKAWAYLAPALILLTIFTFYPMINNLALAFLEGYDATEAIGGATYDIGFYNFATIFDFSAGDYSLKQPLINTTLIVFVTVPASVIISLLIAVALNSIKPLQKFFQTVFFMPYVTNSIAIGMVFTVMFSTDYGLINNLFGLDQVWIGSKATWGSKMIVLLIYITWRALPFKILIIMSGLQSIDKQYYQAAQIDATPRWRVFTRITVPLLSPILLYITVTSFMGAWKEYSSVVGLFGANDREMNTIVAHIYLYFDRVGMTGFASATAVVLLIIVLAFTMLNLFVSKKLVHY